MRPLITRCFSAAARSLGLAPSSVARGIGTLEDDLGVRLLNRTTRKLSLTEAGRLYHERSKRILAEIDDARLSRPCPSSWPAIRRSGSISA